MALPGRRVFGTTENHKSSVPVVGGRGGNLAPWSCPEASVEFKEKVRFIPIALSTILEMMALREGRALHTSRDRVQKGPYRRNC